MESTVTIFQKHSEMHSKIMNICSSAGKCGNLLEQKSGKPVKHLCSLYQFVSEYLSFD